MARIAGVNIPTNKIVQTGLTYIYGIGNKFSKQICKDLDISKSKRVSELTDEQILKIREYIDKNFTVEGDLRRENSLSIKRYDTYMNKTKPVLDFYSLKSNFHEIDGSQKIEVISSKIEQILSV